MAPAHIVVAAYLVFGSVHGLVTMTMTMQNVVPDFTSKVNLFATALAGRNLEVIFFNETTEHLDFWAKMFQTNSELLQPWVLWTSEKVHTEYLNSSTLVVTVDSIEHVDWEVLNRKAFYVPGKPVIGLISTASSSSDDKHMSTTRAAIQARCNSWTVHGMALSQWFLLSTGTWLGVKPYPNLNDICRVELLEPSAAWSINRTSNSPAVTNFHGHEMVVSTKDYPPFAKVTQDPTTGDVLFSTGSDFLVLQYLSEKLNFTTKMTVPGDGDWGVDMGNGSWTGIIGTVQHRQADLGVSALNAFPTYPPVVDYLEPWEEECVSIVTRRAKIVRSGILFTVFDPYPFWIWIAIGLILVFTVTVDYWARRFTDLLAGTWMDMFFMYFEALVGFGAPEWKLTFRAVPRMVWTAWVFFTFFLMVAYSTFLISSLTIPRMDKLPTTLEEFLDSPHNYKMIRVDWGDSVDDWLERSRQSLPIYQRLFERLTITGPYNIWWEYEPLSQVGGDWFGLIEPYSDGWSAVMFNDPGEFVVSKARLVCFPVAYAAPFNGVFGAAMGAPLRMLSRFGVLKYQRTTWRESAFNRSLVNKGIYESKEALRTQREEVALVLSMDNVASVFFCWSVGLALASITFITELLLPEKMQCFYDKRRIQVFRLRNVSSNNCEF